MSLSREELGPALSRFAVLRAALLQVTQDIEPGLDGLAQPVAATLIRRPNLRQAPYHGILAQNATLRAAVTSDGRDLASPVTEIGTSVAARAPNLSLRSAPRWLLRHRPASQMPASPSSSTVPDHSREPIRHRPDSVRLCLCSVKLPVVALLATDRSWPVAHI